MFLYAEFRLEEAGVIEYAEQPGSPGQQHVSWSDMALLIFGAACQQGNNKQCTSEKFDRGLCY